MKFCKEERIARGVWQGDDRLSPERDDL